MTPESGLALALQGWREQDLVSAGTWERLADGTCMWRLSIVSRGAQSHVLVFRCAER